MKCLSCKSREARLGTAAKILSSGSEIVFLTGVRADKCEACEEAEANEIRRSEVRKDPAKIEELSAAIIKRSQQLVDAADLLVREAEVLVRRARELRRTWWRRGSEEEYSDRELC